MSRFEIVAHIVVGLFIAWFFFVGLFGTLAGTC